MKNLVVLFVCMIGLMVSLNAQAPKNTCIVLDGTAGIEIPVTFSGWPSLSIESWFKYVDTETWRWVFGTGPDYCNLGMAVAEGDSIMRYHITTTEYGTSTYDGKKLLTPGTWYHIAMVFDGETVKIFIDGELDFQANDNGRIKITNTKYAIGAGYWSGNEIFKGAIDEVRIWNRAITQTEIKNNMNKELTGKENGLKNYYPCNEGSGDVLYDIASGQNGVIKSGVTWFGTPSKKTNPSNPSSGTQMPFGN